MLKIKRILYPTDFSATASHAFPFAVKLAEQFDAELEMLHALVLHADDPGNVAHRFPGAVDLYESFHESAAEQMGAAAATHIDGGLKVRQEQVRGISAPGVVLDYTRDHDIDLVVMGTHGRRGLRRLLLGSVAEEVVRLAPCPVLTVLGRGETEPRPRFGTIVVPIDFSEHSKLALGYAAEIAKLHGARIKLFHVVEETVYPAFYLPMLPSGEAVTERLIKEGTSRLRGLAGEAVGSIECEVHLESGRAVSKIVDFAQREGGDLIVIASHGLTGLSHMLLGSVTESVVRQASCPVLTVKALGKRLY